MNKYGYHKYHWGMMRVNFLSCFKMLKCDKVHSSCVRWLFLRLFLLVLWGLQIIHFIESLGLLNETKWFDFVKGIYA